MGKLSVIFQSILLAAITLVLFGCAQPPKEEETAAKDALQGARVAEAPTYAQREWSDADQTYTAAETKMQNREYDDAKKLFLSTQEKARVARESARKNKAGVTAEVTKSKESAEAAISNAKSEFEKQRKKVTKDAAVHIEGMVKETEQNIQDANQMIAQGKLSDAKDRLVAASSKADGAAMALADAMKAKQTKHAAPKHATAAAAKHSTQKHATHRKKG